MTAQPSPSPGLWRQIREDWVAHGRDWTKPGFRAVAVHRFGVWLRPEPIFVGFHAHADVEFLTKAQG